MTRLLRLARSPWMRTALVAVAAVTAGGLIWWRGPAWSDVSRAFRAVQWEWVVAAIGLNLVSVVARSVAWRAVIDQAWHAQQRLHRRYRRLAARGNPTQHIVTAIARELSGFLWAALTH